MARSSATCRVASRSWTSVPVGNPGRGRVRSSRRSAAARCGERVRRRVRVRDGASARDPAGCGSVVMSATLRTRRSCHEVASRLCSQKYGQYGGCRDPPCRGPAHRAVRHVRARRRVRGVRARPQLRGPGSLRLPDLRGGTGATADEHDRCSGHRPARARRARRCGPDRRAGVRDPRRVPGRAARRTASRLRARGDRPQHLLRRLRARGGGAARRPALHHPLALRGGAGAPVSVGPRRPRGAVRGRRRPRHGGGHLGGHRREPAPGPARGRRRGGRHHRAQHGRAAAARRHAAWRGMVARLRTAVRSGRRAAASPADDA